MAQWLGLQELIAMAQVQPLMRELKSWEPCGTTRKKKKNSCQLHWVTICNHLQGNIERKCIPITLCHTFCFFETEWCLLDLSVNSGLNPGSSDGQESAHNVGGRSAGGLRSIIGSGRSLEKGVAIHSSILAQSPMDRGA